MDLTKEANKRLEREVGELETQFRVDPNEKSYRALIKLDVGYDYNPALERWMAEERYLRRQQMILLSQERMTMNMRRKLEKKLELFNQKPLPRLGLDKITLDAPAQLNFPVLEMATSEAGMVHENQIETRQV